MAKKIYTIASTRYRDNKTYTQTGTLDELVQCFKYTLEVGESWQHEPGNKKINTNPKSIKSLVNMLNKAKTNAAANGSPDRYYHLIEE